jgi:protein-S-isoprenylcysteine O-methyltransferase Ste14
MDKKLVAQGLSKFLFGLGFLVMVLFLPAGTLHYWNAWLFLAILFLPMLAVGLLLLVRNPALLKKRLNAKEEQTQQKIVLFCSAVMFFAAFVLAGLNARFCWLAVPPWAVWIAAAVFLLGYAMYGEVLRENAYLSRTVEVQTDQKVIDTGLYGVVRHPMYTGTVLLFLAMPLILGCLFSFAVMLIYIPIIALRIKNEETVLAEGLKGYPEYMKKVKYRLIPFLW